jgi:predicted peptidase
VIAFGTSLDPQVQVRQSQELAKSIGTSNSPQWRMKGDQRRSYRFEEANEQLPYRVCVPTNWDGVSKLPLVMFLHGAGNTESSYLDANNKLMVKLAQQHGYLLVSPLGAHAAYGTFLRLPAVFGQPEAATRMLAERAPQRERAQELSEKDVINVLELVLNEYPVDRSAMFLTGHSMGSGGTWYLGAKYTNYWTAIAPMSGPFVQESTYPWDRIRKMPIFMSEGTKATPSVAGSRQMRDWMKAQSFKLEYKEVEADHPGMVPLILPDVFDFFDRCRGK